MLEVDGGNTKCRSPIPETQSVVAFRQQEHLGSGSGKITFLVHFKQEKHFCSGKGLLLFFSFKCPGKQIKYFVREY